LSQGHNHRRVLYPTISDAEFIELLAEIVYIRKRTKTLIDEMILFPDGGMSRGSSQAATREKDAAEKRFASVMVKRRG
jgi:hypothetical protein